MLAGGIPLRVTACGYLRHVDDDFNSGFLGRLCKLSGRLHDAWAYRIAEVGPIHSAQRGAHRVEVQQVAKHDLGAGLLQLLRSLVGPMGEYAYSVILFE
jgi:hypothetical protein